MSEYTRIFVILYLSIIAYVGQTSMTFQTLASDSFSSLNLPKVVYYSDFDAKGDGIADDMEAIVKAHEFANRHGIDVKADQGATYYMGGKDLTAIIQTDTDFGTASFIIDDTDVQNRKSPIFLIRSKLSSYKLTDVTSLTKNQNKLNILVSQLTLIEATDNTRKQYIRLGSKQNLGAPQTDVFIVDRDGTVDPNSPIIWNFDKITNLTAYPIDEKNLVIHGGRFTTIANTEKKNVSRFSRNLTVNRSNVIIDGLEHRIIGEGNQGAPYEGFITITNSSYVTVKNSILTGHKTYYKIGDSGKPSAMGSYDITVSRSINVSFINCRQFNSITDNKYWGIMVSNYCKNLLFDTCELSRFDAHMGVSNASIRNSTLGQINAIGNGTLSVENTEVRGKSFINLRPDYGSCWEGELILRNCTFFPANGKSISASLISGYNSGKHDFGYPCFMPELITIENLHIEDSNHPEKYFGPYLFGDFNPRYTPDSTGLAPFVPTKEVKMSNITTSSGQKLNISRNKLMFDDLRVISY